MALIIYLKFTTNVTASLIVYTLSNHALNEGTKNTNTFWALHFVSNSATHFCNTLHTFYYITNFQMLKNEISYNNWENISIQNTTHLYTTCTLIEHWSFLALQIVVLVV